MEYKQRIESISGNRITLASIKRRFFAFLIDWIVIVLLYLLIILIFSLFGVNGWNINVITMFDVEIETNIHNHYFIILLKIFFGLLPVLYFTLSLFFSDGRTLGKYLLGLKVVSLYHKHVGLWHCFERSLGYFTSALESGFGFIQAIWNPNRMALHDKIGETLVICLPRRKNR